MFANALRGSIIGLAPVSVDVRGTDVPVVSGTLNKSIVNGFAGKP